jgi:Tfp pilus assembly protein PilE
MVANGNEQDPEIYLDRSSPTVAIHSILTCLCISAYNNMYKVAKLNVKWAFIQTDMQGAPAYIRCNRMTELMVKTLPDLKKYVCNQGWDYVLQAVESFVRLPTS